MSLQTATIPETQSIPVIQPDFQEDLLYKGRESNKKLGNFRLFGKSKHQQYFTPLILSETICKMLLPAIEKDELKNLAVIDPTCGSGRLLHSWKKIGANVIGIELDKDTGQIAKKLIGKENIRIGDLLDYADKLNDFDIAVTNPPYGIWWETKDCSFSFESECYGKRIESQTAALEITTQALKHAGILVSIIPSSTFINSKDKRARDFLYDNYNLLLKATLSNVFKKEYNIDVRVDLIIAQKVSSYYDTEDQNYKTIELDILNNKSWQETLVSLMHQILMQNEELKLYPSSYKPFIPYLDRIKAIPIENKVSITAKGISGSIASQSLLDFNNQTFTEYNPIQGMPTGLIDSYLSTPNIILRGIKPGQELLNQLGFNVEINAKQFEQLQRLKKMYDFFSTPVYKPKPHQLLAYYYDKEYTAKKTVSDKDGSILFKQGKKYPVHPTWIRNREVVKIEKAYDESKKKHFDIKTEVDKGYLSIKVETESGEKSFDEINVEDIKTFTEAFGLPDIKDLDEKYPELVEKNRKFIDKHLSFLFDYQKEDMARLSLKPFGYCGYDMGGGKTVCAGAWATIRGYKRVLVVCASGLVNNWINELEKFGFSCKKFTTHKSIDLFLQEKRNKIKLKNPVFYVTSYEFLSLDTAREYDEWDCIEYDKDGNIRRQSLNNTSKKCPLCHKSYSRVVRECPQCSAVQEWTGSYCQNCGYSAYTYTSDKRMYPAYKRISKLFSAVIVDEVQMAKTKNSGRGKAVRALKSKGKLILTGTLMKGYVTDVYFNVGWILGYNNPLFYYKFKGGSKSFLSEFGTFEYVTKQFEDTLSEGRARLLPEVSNVNRFWRIFASFTIRRLKDEMIELPEKHRHIILLPMDEEHKAVYNQYQEWAQDTIKNALSRAERSGTNVNMGVISGALWKLRFCATVPTAKSYLTNNDNAPSVYLQKSTWNKINKILEIVKQIKSRNEKVIIFSGLRPMVSKISEVLKQNYINFVSILASHKTSQRFQMIQDFSQDESITAIVTGLNVLNRGFTITSANNVIITDIEYTPESILQAEDRSHRTGQTKEVNIYYLFSKGSMDETMFELVSKKQRAISNAIDGKANYEDVAKLLREVSGNIQLEIAKRIVKQKPVIAFTEKPKTEKVAKEIQPEVKKETTRENLWEELYELKLKLKPQRRKKNKTNKNQLTLFQL